jgi:hypothetical protein
MFGVARHFARRLLHAHVELFTPKRDELLSEFLD